MELINNGLEFSTRFSLLEVTKIGEGNLRESNLLEFTVELRHSLTKDIVKIIGTYVPDKPSFAILLKCTSMHLEFNDKCIKNPMKENNLNNGSDVIMSHSSKMSQ